MEKFISKKKFSKDSYLKKYKHSNYKLIKFSEEEVDKFDKKHNINHPNYLLEGKKWAKIDSKYCELPRPLSSIWFKNLNNGIKVGLCLLAVGVLSSAVCVPLYLLNGDKSKDPDESIVTSEEWTNAFNYLTVSDKNRKLNMTFDSTIEATGEDTKHSTSEIEIDGYNEKQFIKEDKLRIYFTKDTVKDNLFMYKETVNADSKWTVATSNDTLPSTVFDLSIKGTGGYSTNYKKFTRVNDKYVTNNYDINVKMFEETVPMKSNCEIVFTKDKKLEKLDEVLTGDVEKPGTNKTYHIKITNKYSFSNYGKTQITLPSPDPKLYDGKVISDEWTKAFNNIYNVEMKDLNYTYKGTSAGPYTYDCLYRFSNNSLVSVDNDGTTYEKYKSGCWFTLNENKLISKVSDNNKCVPSEVIKPLYEKLNGEFSNVEYYETTDPQYSYLNKTYKYDQSGALKFFTEFNVDKNINRIYSLQEQTEGRSEFYDYNATSISEDEVPSNIANLFDISKKTSSNYEYVTSSLTLSSNSDYFFTLELEEGSQSTLKNCKFVTYNGGSLNENESPCMNNVVEVYENGAKLDSGYSLSNNHTISFSNSLSGDSKLMIHIKTISGEISKPVIGKFIFDIA